MKILCDVCEKDEASYFCVADEAALCAACDHRVHHANKLAGKHHRFSLLQPKQAPICDICQERRAFLFCQQDRALLCRECDVPIHKANEHTKKHTRFLLSGVKLSADSTLYSASDDVVSSAKAKPASIPHCTPSPAKSTTPQSTTTTTSSISEYLMETLPGWHVEDLLDSSSPSPYQSGENDMMPIWDGDFGKNINISPTENMGFWVPQAPPLVVQQTQNQSFQSADNLDFGSPNGYYYKDHQSKEFIFNKSTRKRSEDNSFAVPQITPSSTTIEIQEIFGRKKNCIFKIPLI